MAELLVKIKKPRQYAKERKDAVDNSIERIAELREDRNSGALGDEVIKMAQALILCTLPYRPTGESVRIWTFEHAKPRPLLKLHGLAANK